MKTTGSTWALTAGLVLAAFSSLAASDPVMVVSAKSPISVLTVDQASEIYLGRLSALPGGIAVTPLEQADGSPAHDDFHARVTRKSGPMLKAYWSRVIFTGRGQPPREVADDDAVKKTLAGNPNAVGYVNANAVDPTVKVVLTLGGK